MKCGCNKDLRPALLNRFFNNDFLAYMADDDLPKVNIKETSKQYKLEISAPGFEKEDFDVRVDHNMLIITAEDHREVEDKDGDEKVLYQGFVSSTFTRSFTLPDNVDTDRITAKGKNGILTIKVTKLENAPETAVKQIEIK